MSENKFETVSLLVDNYRQDDDAFKALIEDEQLSDTWERYHLIGDALRGEVSTNLPLDLSASIASAIADEPTVLAPAAQKATPKTTRKTIKTKVIQLFKPLGQMAIAASAAGLMILGVQQNSAENDVIVPNQVVQTVPLGIANPVSLNFQQPKQESTQKQAYIEQQRRFQALLSDHEHQVKLKPKKIDTTTKSLVDETPKP
jgi:sigma-E factor negative regulatory protein RseA